MPTSQNKKWFVVASMLFALLATVGAYLAWGIVGLGAAAFGVGVLGLFIIFILVIASIPSEEQKRAQQQEEFKRQLQELEIANAKFQAGRKQDATVPGQMVGSN